MRLLAALPALALLAMPPTATAEPRCATPPGAKVVAATDEAVVTVETHSDGRDFLDGGRETSIWRGCAQSTGAQVELENVTSSWGGFGGAYAFALAGGFVAYRAEFGDKYETEGRLTVVDLADATRHDADFTWTQVGSGSGIARHAVNRLGGVAWVRVTHGSAGRRQWRLYLERAGQATEIARARRPIRALRLGTLKLRWRGAGRQRTYRLDG